MKTSDTTKNRTVLELPPRPGNGRNSEGSFITLKSGRILFLHLKATTDSFYDDTPAEIASRYSDDGGLTWSDKERIVVAGTRTKFPINPSLLRLQDGRIALLYSQIELRPVGGCRSIATTGGVKMPMYANIAYICFSDDEARTFSRPRKIFPIDGLYGINNDRMIQLASGRLVIPVAYHRFRGPTYMPSDNKQWRDLSTWKREAGPAHSLSGLILHYLSDDGGRTWFESNTNHYAPERPGERWGFQEPGAVQLKDGRLWGYMRYEGAWRYGNWDKNGKWGPWDFKRQRQWSSYSDTEGLLWSEPEPSAFVSPCSPMSVKRIPQTGDLLAVWNDWSGRFQPPDPTFQRVPLVSAISTNEGRTWKHHRLLEDDQDRGYCYTAIHFTDDGHVLLAYCAGLYRRCVLETLRIRRVALKELYV